MMNTLAAQLSACEQGVLPPRYARNGNHTSTAHQARLLRSRVLLVGLGGLGGHVLDMLIRMGVGHIVGADGDIFEESNLNRQLLCTCETLGMPKAEAAALYVARVNPAVDFVPVGHYLRGKELQKLVTKGPDGEGAFDLVVDALGGMKDRRALQSAAQMAKIPLVSAGIAGLTGWMQVVQPGKNGPMDFFSRKDLSMVESQQSCGETDGSVPMGQCEQEESAEVLLGNLAPTVALAAALQCAQVYSLLTRETCTPGMIVFDLEDQYFNTLKM